MTPVRILADGALKLFTVHGEQLQAGRDTFKVQTPRALIFVQSLAITHTHILPLSPSLYVCSVFFPLQLVPVAANCTSPGLSGAPNGRVSHLSAPDGSWAAVLLGVNRTDVPDLATQNSFKLCVRHSPNGGAGGFFELTGGVTPSTTITVLGALSFFPNVLERKEGLQERKLSVVATAIDTSDTIVVVPFTTRCRGNALTMVCLFVLSLIFSRPHSLTLSLSLSLSL